MNYDLSQLAVLPVLVGCFWSILCRLAALKPSARTAVAAVQHIALGMGVFGGMVLTPPSGTASLAVGLALFLALGAFRWRNGAPNDLHHHPEA